jgi:predicted MFS family arabinose efflux permease
VAHDGRTVSTAVTAVRAAAAFGAAVGVGRFVFTPILPMMQEQAHVTPGLGGNLALVNYAGYLAGAFLAMCAPRSVRSRLVLRASGLSLAASLGAMALTTSTATWLGLRLVAGAASALLFVAAAGAVVDRLHGSRGAGWAYAGVGGGIALSGGIALVTEAAAAGHGWRAAWWVAAACTGALVAASWHLADPTGGVAAVPRAEARARGGRWFWLLLASYVLEGAGYIVAGTFLVAAVHETSQAAWGDAPWVGPATWILVGVAAVPSCVLWSALSTRAGRPALLAVALGLQTVGIAALALAPSAATAVVAAVLFGGTFIGATTLTLAAGAHLEVPAAVAILSAAYAVGQIAGPAIATPVLPEGYGAALGIGAGLVALATLAAALTHIGFPAPARVDRPAAPAATPVLKDGVA